MADVNATVITIGRSAPIPKGQQTMQESLPVVVASDQSAVPVSIQNQQISEVSLSLLGIPRTETALGIFSDVTTYDVNPNPNTFHKLGSASFRLSISSTCSFGKNGLSL